MGYGGRKVLKWRMDKAEPIRGCQKGSFGQPSVTIVKHEAFKDRKKQ